MVRKTSTVSARPHQPIYPTRILNLLGKFKKRRVSDPDELMSIASTSLGLDDFGGEDFIEAMTIFLKAHDRDDQMSPMGRMAARRLHIKLLMDRLEIQQTLKNHQEILNQPITTPILIAGCPRCGTTFLQRLMALDSRFKITLAWESYWATSPVKKEDYESNPFIEKTKEYFDLLAKTSPALFTAHPMKHCWPEECALLIERQFIRLLFSMFWEVEEYLEWLMDRSDEDLTVDYQYYKKQLQILQYHWDEPKWLLKAPIHGPFLTPIKNVFPDMRFIFCHREPSQMIPSTCSLITARKGTYYSNIDLKSLGEKVIQYFHRLFDKIETARDQSDSSQVIDVSFRRMIENPIETVEELYHQLDLELTAELKTRMREFIESQKKGKHIHHRYHSEDFSLNSGEINRIFADYIEGYQDFL
jgi:hypothetical protein